MPANPVYFISSLPGLDLGTLPPFSFTAFLDKAKDFIPSQEMEILKNISTGGEYAWEGPLTSVLRKWYAFDTALRNELVRLRAGHKRAGPDRYIRPLKGYPGNDIAHIAISAHKNPSIIEAERFLDEQRWAFLDSLLFGHYFDLGFLAVYGLKLLILQRWERVEQADREELIRNYV